MGLHVGLISFKVARYIVVYLGILKLFFNLFLKFFFLIRVS